MVFSARPERFELPTPWFVARYSIQLSYGRVLENLLPILTHLKNASSVFINIYEGFI